MLSGSPLNKIIKFGLPILIGNLFQQVYIAVDTIMISAALNNDAVLAIGNAGILYTALLWFIQGMAMGFAVLNSQAYGTCDAKKVRESLAITFTLSGILTILLTGFMLLSLDKTLQLINIAPASYQYAKDYLIIMYAGLGASLFLNVMLNSMRALGDANHPLLYLVSANILNIVLDYVFVIVLKMGTVGAGIATIISQFSSFIGCMISMYIKFPKFRLKFKDFISSKSYYLKHLTYASTNAIQFTIIAFTLIAQQIFINKQSSDIMIGYVIGYKIDQFAQQFIGAFAISLATFVGQNFGAKNYERIKVGVKQTALMIAIISIAMTIVLLLLGRILTIIYLPNATVDIINASQKYIIYEASFYMFLALLLVYRNASQNLGRYKLCFIACLMEFTSRLVGVLAFGDSFDAIIMSNVIGWIGSCAILIPTYYLTMHKLTNKRIVIRKTNRRKFAFAH